MSNKVQRIYWNQARQEYWPTYTPQVELVVGDVKELQFQVFDKYSRFTLNTSKQAADADTLDLSAFTGVHVAINSSAGLDAGTTAEASWSGGYTASGWQSLTRSRAAQLISLASTFAPGRYLCSAWLSDASENRFSMGDRPFVMNVRRRAETDSDASPPVYTSSGQLTISGTSTATSWQTVTGLTSTGIVIPILRKSTGGYTDGTVEYDTNRFRITVPRKPEVTSGDGRTFVFDWVLYKLTT